MNFLVSGFVSPELSSDFANKIGSGDLIAAVLALLSIAALSWRWLVAIPIVWIFNIWGTLDLLNAYYMGVTQIGNPGLFGAGIYIPALYVPILLVSHVLIFMLLLRARSAEGREKLGPEVVNVDVMYASSSSPGHLAPAAGDYYQITGGRFQAPGLHKEP
jgi:hypothetical protein